MRSGTARSREGDARPFPAYFEWRPASGAISIHLSFAVMDQLEADIMKGFCSVPKRGAEVGGILFGHAEISEFETVVHIDDFEPVECEYRRGPSYVLSDADKRRLERTLRKGRADRQVVGFYRSHTRPGLYLDQDDFGLIQSYFPGSSQVFLLVRPHASKTSTGGFFFWEEENLRRQATYLEFPFSRTEILKQTAGGNASADSDSAAAPPPLEAPPPQPAAGVPPGRGAVRPLVAPSSARWSAYAGSARAFFENTARTAALYVRRAGWRPWAAAAIALVGLALVEYPLLKLLARRTVAGDAEGRPPALRIERNGSYLQVDWNRNSSAVAQAQRGVLEITDGTFRQELQLDARQLRTGSVAYSPATHDVSFRLELVGANGSLSESLRVVEGTGQPASRNAGAQPPVTRPDLGLAGPPAAPVRTAATHSPRPRTAVRKPAHRTARSAWYDDGL
jgi:hypothetical protein